MTGKNDQVTIAVFLRLVASSHWWLLFVLSSSEPIVLAIAISRYSASPKSLVTYNIVRDIREVNRYVIAIKGMSGKLSEIQK